MPGGPHGLQNHCRLVSRVEVCSIRTLSASLHIADCRLRIADLVLAMVGSTQPNPQSAIRNPQSDGRSPFRTYRLKDGLRLGELAGGQLRMNLLSIDSDFKRTAARRNELEGSNILFEPQKLFRQTDGMRLIVSSRAIFDGDLNSHSWYFRRDYGRTCRASRTSWDLRFAICDCRWSVPLNQIANCKSQAVIPCAGHKPAWFNFSGSGDSATNRSASSR